MKTDPKNSLLWIRNRLQNKFHDDQLVIDELDSIINNYLLVKKIIPIQDIEKICKKYYADWDFEKSELSFGMDDTDKVNVRTFIINLLKDLVSI